MYMQKGCNWEHMRQVPLGRWKLARLAKADEAITDGWLAYTMNL